MSKICQITGKKAMVGNNVSHSKRRTKRKFDVNLFTKKFYWVEQDCWVSLNISAAGLRTIKNLVKEEYMIALANVTAAKADVAKAKRNIEKLAAGTYTDIDYITESLASIQENIKVKQAEYDAAKADYDAASAQLKALLAIFLK